MLTSFSVAVAIRMARAAPVLPRPRVSLVPAPSYRLDRDHDHREVLDQPSFAVSLDLASPLTSPHENVSYRRFDTTSQSVSLGSSLLLLDDATGRAPNEPGQAHLDLSPGRHVVHATIDWSGSESLELNLAAGAITNLVVAPAGGAVDFWQVFTRRGYLTLGVDVERPQVDK